GGFEDALDVPQVFHPLLHVHEALLDEVLRLFTASRRSVSEVQKACNIFEREARGLGRSDEPKPPDSFLPVEPVVALAAALGFDKANSLVIQNGRGRNPRNTGQLANRF